jgi:hypothetical protein
MHDSRLPNNRLQSASGRRVFNEPCCRAILFALCAMRYALRVEVDGSVDFSVLVDMIGLEGREVE